MMLVLWPSHDTEGLDWILRNDPRGKFGVQILKIVSGQIIMQGLRGGLSPAVPRSTSTCRCPSLDARV